MKKLSIVTALILVLGMFTFALAQDQVESGTWSASGSSANYTLNKNEGNRNVIVEVEFDQPFDSKPDVVIGVTMLDASSEKNIRYNVTTLSVSRDGFSINIATWAETKIFGIAGFWMAHAEAKE